VAEALLTMMFGPNVLALMSQEDEDDEPMFGPRKI